MTITIGSLFSGIGGFELGLERAIPDSSTIWQVEQDKYCQSILKKHWPESILYDDVCSVGAHNLKPVDIICGGFPCQDISTAGKGKGINEGKKSGLYWEMFRIICELRPRIIIMENVPALANRGLSDVLGSLASVGYDAEWISITASMFGAPHRRKRLFVVAYSSFERRNHGRSRLQEAESRKGNQSEILYCDGEKCSEEFNRLSKARTVADSNSKHAQIPIEGEHSIKQEPRSFSKDREINFWREGPVESPICSMDDGISGRISILRALGNAIVPQCSQWVGEQIVLSGLIDSLC